MVTCLDIAPLINALARPLGVALKASAEVGNAMNPQMSHAPIRNDLDRLHLFEKSFRLPVVMS